MSRLRIRSGAWNAHWPFTANQQMHDVLRMMGGKFAADVVSASEVQRDLASKIRAAGYGIYVEKSGYDDAVIWDKSKYDAVDTLTRRLNKNSTTYGGMANVRDAAAVLLRDKETGQEFWQVAVHLAPKKQGTKAQQRRVQAEQIIQLNRLVHQLAKDGVPVIVGGDFNFKGAHVDGMTKNAQTDVMYMFTSGARGLQSHVISGTGNRSFGSGPQLHSDHGGIISTFLAAAKGQASGGSNSDGGKKHPHGGGNGGNGDGGPVVTDTSAYALLENLFQSWGLPLGSDIEAIIKQAMKDGITPDQINQIMPQLEATDTWKTRFAGNEILKKNGQSVLSVPEYLAAERAYSQIMHNNGLPKGFYDDPSDFAKFIGNSVSADELSQRVSAYADLANREDPAIVAQLQSMGLSKGDLLAHMIDPERAAPLIQQQYREALIGGAARRAGLTPDNNYLAHLAAQGVTEDQASQGYGLIAGSLSDANTLSKVYGENYGQSDMEAEVFDNSADAGKKRKRLASQERGAFSGSAGIGKLTQNNAGSY